ncbi:MAG: ABC transporter ATP-binding protein [Syntrophomonadaceae bacterium]|nr:ABC transporter ATP-binding protein [Syntrophomonadaceae bacterium]
MIRIEHMSKFYQMGEETVTALQDVSLHILPGELTAIVGPSGSGKSTLMNMIGCLDVPDSGQYFLDGKNVSRMDENELADIRNRKVGFIFQQYNLLPRLTALENVELPLLYRGLPAAERREKAQAALARMGLADRMKHRPAELSGGQQQRVSVARALAGEPPLLLADEPTGALDSKTSQALMDILLELNQSHITVVLITHDLDIARQAKVIYRIADGFIGEREVWS